MTFVLADLCPLSWRTAILPVAQKRRGRVVDELDEELPNIVLVTDERIRRKHDSPVYTLAEA